MSVPTQPILTSYNGITHVIGGTAEPGTTVMVFNEAVQFGPSVTATEDGSFTIAVGELTAGQVYSFVAIASNGDGDSLPSPVIEINARSTGEWISAEGTVDYDFTGTDGNDSLGFRTQGDLTLRGGEGNDSYYVDSILDVVLEDFDGGYDRIDINDDSGLTEYTLPDNVEWLSGPIEFIALNGNDLDNDVVGRGTLNGGVGNDTVRGIGNDTFDPGSVLLGGVGDDTLSGDNGNDTIDGGPGDNDLAIFGAFNSGLRAGDAYITQQDDGFVIFDARERFETFHQGMDFVRNVEFFQFVDQTIAVEDLLDRSSLPPPIPLINFFDAKSGKIGGTALPGVEVSGERTTNFGGTNEVIGTAIADPDGNWVIDFDPVLYDGGSFSAYAQNDFGRSSESTDFLVGDMADSPRIISSDALLDDTLIGTDGSDSLSGGFAKSTLIGGEGDDLYSYDDDVTIIEDPDSGIDTVFTFLSEYTLGENLENVTARAASSVLNGNAADNVLTGNDRRSRGDLFETNETLNGGEGDDTLNGLRGDDFLDGGPGTDTVIFSSNAEDYRVTREAGGFRLIDQRGDETDEGSNLVINVELFQFDDGTLTTDELNIEDSGILVEGSPDNDSLVAESTDDTLRGLEGNDTLDGLGGSDLVDGGDGLDLVLFHGDIVEFSAFNNQDQIVVTGPAFTGSDTLIDVERLQFDDMSLAFDLDGNAGNVAKLLGIMLGPDDWYNRTYVGIGLDFMDNSGISYEQLMDIALEFLLGANPSNEEVFTFIYTNVVGASPSQTEIGHFTGLMDNGTYTQAGLAVAAAEHEINAANIDLVGLIAYGVEYVAIV